MYLNQKGFLKETSSKGMINDMSEILPIIIAAVIGVLYGMGVEHIINERRWRKLRLRYPDIFGVGEFSDFEVKQERHKQKLMIF